MAVARSSACSPMQMVVSGLSVSVSFGRTVMVIVALSLGVVQLSLNTALYIVVVVGCILVIELLVIRLLLVNHCSWWAVVKPPVGVALNSACSPIQMVLSVLSVSVSFGRTVMVMFALSLSTVQPSLNRAL